MARSDRPYPTPRRHAPFSVRTAVLFGGCLNQAGWLLLGVGLASVWAFVPKGDLTSWFLFRGPVTTASGVVAAVSGTQSSEDTQPILAVEYEFVADDGQQYRGTSYVTGETVRRGSSVTVEYPAARPTLSRMQGARRAVFPGYAAIVILLPLAGLAMAVSGLRQGLRAIDLLRNGRLAVGRLVRSEVTGMLINEQPVRLFAFEFVADDGRTYEAVARTHVPHLLHVGADRPVLYAPDNPAHAMVPDGIPGAPLINGRGEIVVRNPVSAFGALVVPGVAVLANVAYAWLRFVQ